MTTEKPSIEAVRALEAFIAGDGRPEHLLTFQGILRSHEDMRAALSSPPADDVREALARVMADHYYIERWSGGEATCTCRQWVESVQRRPYTTWPQHVADALIAAEVRLRGTVTDAEEEVSRLEQIAGKVEVSRQTVTDAEVWCPHWSPGRITKRAGCSACYAGARVSAENTTPTNHPNGSAER